MKSLSGRRQLLGGGSHGGIRLHAEHFFTAVFQEELGQQSGAASYIGSNPGIGRQAALVFEKRENGRGVRRGDIAGKTAPWV